MSAAEELVGAELVPAPPTAPISLFRSEDPDEIIAEVARTANVLAAVVEKQNLSISIQRRRYVLVDGWQCLATLCRVYPVVTWTRQLENGWEARVEVVTRAGEVVGAAEAMCLRSERNWSDRDEFALRSMAQTRAISKALRGPLGFVMAMAGFATTPAEEMPLEPDPPAAAVASTASTPAAAAGNDLASEAQAKNIFRLLNKIDKAGLVTRDKLLEAIGSEYGTENPYELSKQDASDLITRLKAKAGESES